MPKKGLEAALGRSFSRPDLLRSALTHASHLQDRKDAIVSYERLEFLGDRVLALVIADLLFARFPDEDEGALARRHAVLVSRESLVRVAEVLDLGAHMILSRGEEEAGGRNNPGMLADVCEAVIAALYLDGGLEVAAAFVRQRWASIMAQDPTPPKDAKTTLQEWVQARGLPLPVYREIGRQGPPHAPTFLIEAVIEGLPTAVANGTSKRAAEQAAARALLNSMESGDDQ
ncbi:MAG: ribonuclease III [candidate division Zixibacteria bacterium]|nr:ribonuclease III [candidate division Zixibacteria bacterium]